ncbi:MAG: NFACT family protein [Lachnospiraceae bacterium]|nr:NFACT family protein [Lachnospiraceae bacterium]
MAYDGLTVAAVTDELNKKLTGGRIYRIAQPENDALLLTVKTGDGQYRLLLSANASLPMVTLTQDNRPNPMTAPNFCMLLRKHLQNARILGFSQPGLERVIRLEAEHYNEMGDLCSITLVTEIMGKHSNIILTEDRNGEEIILDSIKHISGMVSSVREVLPGRKYFIPETRGKSEPLDAVRDDFFENLGNRNMSVSSALCTAYRGISNQIAGEIVRMAGIDPDMDIRTVLADENGTRLRLWESFSDIMEDVRNAAFTPVIYYENGIPAEFSAVDTGMYENRKNFKSISELLYVFYSEKEAHVRIRQRSAELRHVVQTASERVSRKLDLQEKQLKDTEKREKNRLYGELLTAYAYQIPEGSKYYDALNYNDGSTVRINLDETLSVRENAARFFEKYQKQKRTFEALSVYVKQSQDELAYLDSIKVALDIALKEEDLLEIKEELAEAGYIRKHNNPKKKIRITSKPFHYVTEDGYDIYVGKNNYQNEELTFKFADGGDMWFHSKKIPGSHVIVRTGGKELPDHVYEQAAALAAYYSGARDQDKAEIDYTVKKNVKKPSGAAPGFVIYYTNYSMTVRPGIDGLTLLSE